MYAQHLPFTLQVRLVLPITAMNDQPFTLLRIPEEHLQSWAIQRARSLGLDTVADLYPDTLLAAADATRTHLRGIVHETMPDRVVKDKPEWDL